MKIHKALTIAGSDSGAGAGIQADLKTFAAFGVYGTSVITAITAQNTVKVTRIFELSRDLVAAQIDAVIQDIGAAAVKTGMLANAQLIEMIAEKIRRYKLKNLVVDPVMVAKSGDLLLRRDAVRALRSRLIPLARVVTPNLPEAEELTGIKLTSHKKIIEAGRRIIAMGAQNVVIKGGHRKGPAVDLFFTGTTIHELRSPRIRTRHTHGTGCTFSAAITASLAKGETLEKSIVSAKSYITAAIRNAFAVGSGHSPVHHFYRSWKR